MNKDVQHLSEAYSRIYLKEDAEFQDQMPDSKENAEITYGVDPDEAKEYDDMKKDISYQNYAFWDAYHAVKEGAWTEDDFDQWARSVWADGADNQASGNH